MSEHDETTDEVAQMPGVTEEPHTHPREAEMPTPEELAEQMAASAEAVPPIETECAFVMFLVNGHWVADGSLIGREIRSARDASFDDFRHAAHTLTTDINARATAEQVVGLQMQQAQQFAQQQKDAEISAKIAQEIQAGRGGKLLGKPH
jgi:hypothetical protein